MISGIPQGSVLGTAQFNIFVSDKDNRIECTLSKSVDDTKLCVVVATLAGKDVIQRNIERWARVNNMRLKKAKSKALQLGQGNPKHKYRLAYPRGQYWVQSSLHLKDTF